MLKKMLSVILALMLFASMPLAAFADEADDLRNLKTDAGNNAADASTAKDNISNGDQANGIASYDDAEQAYKDAKDAAGEATGAIDEINKTGGVLDTAKDALDDIQGVLDDVDAGTADPTDLVDPFNDGKDAVQALADDVKTAVDAADKAVTHAQTVIDAANTAVNEANSALNSADEALRAARDADDIYQKMLEDAIANGVPADVIDIANAENAMVESWNKFMGYYGDALQKVDTVIDEAKKAQAEAEKALTAWRNAEAAYAKLADAAGLKEVAELRYDVLDLASQACMDALDAVIMAAQLREWADIAGNAAINASTAVNDAVGIANGIIGDYDDMLNFAQTTYTTVGGIIYPNGEKEFTNQPAIGGAGAVTFGYFTSADKAIPAGVDTIWLILSDGTEIKLVRQYDSKNKPTNDFYFDDPDYANTAFSGFPVDNRKANESGKDTGEYLLFKWEVSGVTVVNQVYGRYDKTKENEINTAQKNWHFYGTFGEYILEYGEDVTIETEGFGEYRVPSAGDFELYLNNLSLAERMILERAGVTVPKLPIIPPPIFRRVTRTTTTTTTIADAAVPLTNITDPAVPLTDTVTIVDENVPLSGLPVSGGGASTSANNMVLPLAMLDEEFFLRLGNDEDEEEEEEI